MDNNNIKTTFKASFTKAGTKYRLLIVQDNIELINQVVSASQGEKQVKALTSFTEYFDMQVHKDIEENPNFKFTSLDELREYMGSNLQNAWYKVYRKENNIF